MADNTDLLNTLLQWSKAGGGNSAQGSMATDLQGNTSRISSPEIATMAANSISGDQNNQGNTMQNWHGDNTPMQRGPDIGLLLSGLIQKGLQASGGTDVNQVHQELMANVAKKTLTDNLQTHADNLMASNPDAIKILSTAIATHQANQDALDNSGNTVSPTISLTPIQQQANNIVSPATTVLGKIFEAAGFGTKTKEKQLANLSSAQGILGETPIQPSEIAKMDRETYGKTVTGYSDSLANSVDQLKNLRDQYTALDNTRSPIDMVYSRPSQMQLPLLDQMKAVAGQVLENHASLRNVLKNAPKSLSKSGNFRVTKVSN